MNVSAPISVYRCAVGKVALTHSVFRIDPVMMNA